MGSVILFIFGCILCLMFLGMLYGDRLSMIGLFDGEWLGPVSGLFSKLVADFVEAADESIEFLLAHLSWVVAAVSGTAGLVIVGFIMGGGLASDAAAYHRDLQTPLKAGSVMDKVEVVAARAPQASVMMAKSERDDSQLVSQVRSADYIVFGRPEYAPIRPRPRRPIDGSIDFPPSSITERPLLGVTFRRLGTSILESAANPDVITRGRLVDSLPDAFFVDRILGRLGRDNWRESIGMPRDDDAGRPQDDLAESPLAAVKALEARVRVTPGVFVSEHDLRIEKTVPDEFSSGDFTVQISLTNLGDKRIDGLLVREMLPFGTRVRGASPEAAFREDTLTWLVNDLRPAQELMLRFTVVPPNDLTADRRRDAVFESMTEVSAVTAVATRTGVVEDTLPADPFPSDRRRLETPPRRELVGQPDLILQIEEPLEAAPVGEWTRILFTLTNRGTADARAIRLRLTLDGALDHSDLLNRPRSERQVFVDVDQVVAGKSRRFRLEVRPVSRGETVSTAEVILNGNRVDRRMFRLVADDASDRLPPSGNTIR